MWFTQRLHGCQANLIPFCFALVHQRVRHRTDEAHVDSETEAEVLIVCTVSIERWRLAQSSQLLEQVCIQRFRLCEATVSFLRRSVVSDNRLRYHV